MNTICLSMRLINDGKKVVTTHRIIAETMVRGAFHAIHKGAAAHQARVLDPSAGAGVFLITAFRHLVAERWRVDKVRPDTNVLREILYQQITGFDINESALRFAALGLYLMSIELDSHPEPVQKFALREPARNGTPQGGGRKQ